MRQICPVCNDTMEIDIPPGHRGPRPGDVTICAFCQHVLEFTESLGLVRCEDPEKVDECYQEVSFVPTGRISTTHIDDGKYLDDGKYHFQCGACQATLLTPEALLEHMLKTGHNTDAGMQQMLRESPELRAELLERLGNLLEDPGERVEELELPQQARDALERSRRKKKGWFH